MHRNPNELRGRYIKVSISPKPNPTNRYRPWRFVVLSAYVIEDFREVTLHLAEVLNDHCSKTYGEIK